MPCSLLSQNVWHTELLQHMVSLLPRLSRMSTNRYLGGGGAQHWLEKPTWKMQALTCSPGVSVA